MDIIKRIEKWQKERLLDKQEYIWSNEAVNIIEELMEALGYNVPKEKREYIRKDFKEFVKKTAINYNLDDNELTKEDMVDAFADIIVFSVGAILKLGYEPMCVMDECLKEIESRVGSIIDGKFQKDLSKKDQWYKADYSKCKRKKDGI